MGQLLSSQATPARVQPNRNRNVEHSRGARRERPSEVRIGSDQAASKASHQNDGFSSRARNTTSAQGSKASLRPLQEVDGNVGAPRRQQKYVRGKASKDQTTLKDHTHQRVRRSDSLQFNDKSKDANSQRRRVHTSKSGSHHARSHATKECIVCTDKRSAHRFPDRPTTEQCTTHDADVCRRCLRTWIESEFLTKIWNEINCPICASRLQYDDMREFAPHQVFRRYEKLTTKAVYESIPNFRWCIVRGCKSGQVHSPDLLRFKCKACKKSHCVQHNVAWHKGETCQEYDYRTKKHLKKQEEAASKTLIAETTKKCPGCKRSIEKSFGCDHMTCAKCKHEFCWQCLTPYIKRGVRRVVHRQGCAYYNPDWDSDGDYV